MLLNNSIFCIVFCVHLMVTQDIPEENFNVKNGEKEPIDASVNNFSRNETLLLFENNTYFIVNNTLDQNSDDIVNIERESDLITTKTVLVNINKDSDKVSLNSQIYPTDHDVVTSTTESTNVISPTEVIDVNSTTTPTQEDDNEDVTVIDVTNNDEFSLSSAEKDTTTNINNMDENTGTGGSIEINDNDANYIIPKIQNLFIWSDDGTTDIDNTTEDGNISKIKDSNSATISESKKLVNVTAIERIEDTDKITTPDGESISNVTKNFDISTATEIIDINYSYTETESVSTWMDSDTATDLIENSDTSTTTEFADISSATEIFDTSSTTDSSEEEKLAEGEKLLSENILAILEHFKQDDPSGLPGGYLPDPCPVDDVRQSISSFDTMYMTNTFVYGTSKLRILNINVDVKNLKAEAAMSVDVLQARGQYSIISWFNPSSGPYTIDITGMKVLAKASLGVDQDGRLRAQDIHMDITIETIVNNFENLGIVGGMFQNFINSGGTSFFDSNVPYMLEDAYPKIRAEINAKLDKFTDDVRFPNSIPPLDTMVMEVRNYMQYKKLDPFQIDDINMTIGIFTVGLCNTTLTGISSFQRVGNVTLTMENNTVVADFEVGTQRFEGGTQFGLTAAGGLISSFARSSFSIEYLRLRLIIAQPLDTRKKPVLKDMEFEIGNIQARSDGLGTLDYLIELGVNILPNLLRYQIVNALDELVEISIQTKLDELNVEDFIKQSLPLVDVLQNFKLSYLDAPNNWINDKNDDDKFFDF